MARISSKPLATETDITANDYLLGNDLNDGSIITKRFQLEELKNFFLEGTASDIFRRVPIRHLPVVTLSDDGTEEFERAPIQVSYTPVIEPINLIVNGAVDGVDMDYSIDQNGNAFLTLNNYNEEYFLPGFEGVGVEFQTLIGSSEVTYTAVINEYLGLQFQQDDDITRDKFSLTFTSSEVTPLEPTNRVIDLTITTPNSLGNYGILSNMEMASLVVTGGLNIDGDLDIGSNDDRSEINIHGFINFDDPQEGIRFGEESGPNVTLTTDGNGNLIIDGVHPDSGTDGRVIFNDPVDLNNGVVVDEIVFTDGDDTTTVNAQGITATVDGTTLSLQEVTANSPSGNNAGALLTSIEVDGTTYPLPSLDASAVVEALPGLDEALSGPTEAITTGTFFFGTQSGARVTLSSATLLNTVDVTIPEGATSLDFDDFSGDETLFETWYANKATDEVGFFVIAAEAFTGTTYSPDDFFDSPYSEFPGGLYMIVAYNETTNVLTFGKLGTGAITISSDVLNLNPGTIIATQLPDEDDANFDFVTIGQDNILSKSSLDIQGTANGARYNFEGVTEGSISSITFEGDHNISDVGGDVSVDISGRYVEGGVHTTGGATVSLWSLNILDTISTDQQLTLPVAGQFGDSIKFSNVSTLSSSGEDVTSGTWSLLPGGQDRIMKQEQGTALILNDATASFELVYSGNTDIGWVVIGIN